MNKRLQQMIDENKIPNIGGVFIDAYKQSINKDIAGTITTRVDASNMIFCNRDMQYKGNTSLRKFLLEHNKRVFRGQLGGYFKNSKTDDSLATLVMEKEKTDVTICLNSKVDGKQPSLEHRIYGSSGISTAITTGFLPSVTEPQIEQIGNIYPDTDDFKNRTSGRVYSADGLSPTLRTVTGGHNEPKIAERQYRIRKLTPRECFRLMDVSEEDINKIQASGVSNSQQYKMAGNSIVVSCLFHIFRTLFVEKENPDLQMTIFDIL